MIYAFTETLLNDRDVRLEWTKDDKEFDSLDFWIVPKQHIEDAKKRVCEGLFDAKIR